MNTQSLTPPDTDASAECAPKGLNPRLLVVCICFFISGIAGLIYEVVWSRYLALFLGSTGQAHVIVLATYMGGWRWGRRCSAGAPTARPTRCGCTCCSSWASACSG